jgi:AcrR family transcriptional regulator
MPKKKSDPDRAVIDATLALIAERGWRGLALSDIARAAEVPLSQLYARFGSKAAILAAFMAEIDAAVMEGATEIEPDEPARERMFDVLMRRYDLLRPHREALARLAEDLARDPLGALAMAKAARRSMAATREAAGIASDGFDGAVRQNGLLAVHLPVMRVFLADDSPDLAPTMAALDRRLKAAEGWLQRLENIRSFRWKRGPARDREAGDGEARDAAD